MKLPVVLLLVLGLAACAADPVGVATTPIEPASTAVTTQPTTSTSAPPDPSAPSASSSTSAPPATMAPLQALRYSEPIFSDFPIVITARPGDDTALLAERGGRIYLFTEGQIGEMVGDISGLTRTDGERGLLGMVRHPLDDSRLFIHYTDAAGSTTVSEFAFDGVLDRDSERVLLEVAQPASNHNGGMIQFGPDGALYVGLGDGGGGGDPFGHGQNRQTLLGGIVRIDIESGRTSLWHYGLRNPWRFWIDGPDLWVADVGQRSYEEVDLAPIGEPGINYGWAIMEGMHCYDTADCDTEGLTVPLVEIARGDGGTCSITGGIVYRGGAIPELSGRFLFSDYCGGYLRSVDGAGSVIDHTEDVGAPGKVVSFGVDGAGEVYVLTTDRIHKLVPIR